MVRQSLDCTNCGRNFSFNLDYERDGNYEIKCPGCDHVHYRVVEDGIITEKRYRSSSNYATYAVTGTFTTSCTAATTTVAGGSYYFGGTASDSTGGW